MGDAKEVNLDQTLRIMREEVPDLVAVYLFGSCARGNARPESDIDLAVLSNQPLDPLFRWHLQEKLAAALGRNVDLVDLLRASTVMRRQVLLDGKLLYEGDRYGRELFEATSLGMYARLQEERREILKDIQERGHVYE